MATTTTLTDEITDMVTEMYATFATGDATVWTERITQQHQPLGIGTDAEEFWVGRDKLTEVTTAQIRELAEAGVTLTATQIRADSHGQVVWATDEPTLRMGDGTELPLRLTVIAVQEQGELRWTHFHLSAGAAANEEVLDLDLTT